VTRSGDVGPHDRESGLGPHDLIAGYYTLAGSRAGAGEGEPARASLEARAAAAADAGYVGLGILIDDYDAMRAAGRSDADLRAICEDHGIGVPEVEFLYHWACTDERAAFSRELEDRLYRAADAFGAHHLNMGDVNPPAEMPPLEVAAERFAAICDRAAGHGLLVALEFLPWSGIPNAATAWDIVRTADRPNGGINLDVWHHFRGAADDGMLRAIPPERIACVAISDADAGVVGDLIEDTTRHRRLPGRGSFDLVGFLRLLDELGIGAPVTVEILSDEQNARPTAQAARMAIEATRSVMLEAGFRANV
jgi:sugar phosphate isomerase/epimerase